MKRAFLLLLTVGIVSTAVLFAVPDKTTEAPQASEAKIAATVEAKNPWTSLTPNAAADQFQFAVVSDRTGSHRAGVFSKAVQQINLLQPEFVMSVGDLIEGSTVAETNSKDWDEFDGYVRRFAMPFFYCPGNHDALSKLKTEQYKQRYGRPHYHFLYKNCLFVVLNSNDPVDVKGVPTFKSAHIGKAQREWLAGVLNDNPNPRWTFVFLHHPIWNGTDITETGWLEVEKLLTGRKYNAFCGHLHTFRMYQRNGTQYYQFATTGGGSAMRGVEYGEFDQCAWITMKGDKPVIANVVLDGILNNDLSPITSEETGRMKIPEPGTLSDLYGKVTLDGKPAAGLQVTFTEIVTKPADPKATAPKPYVGNSRVDADGTYRVYAHRGAKGVKPGKYVVTVSVAPSFVIDKDKVVENPVPEKYRTVSKSPLRVDVKAGEPTNADFNLTSE